MHNLARKYLGVKQGSKAHRSIVDRYNAVRPLPVGYMVKYSDDWCAVFVTVLADELGIAGQVGRECGVQRYKKILIDKGLWRRSDYFPQPGDIIIFDWDRNGWTDHIGVVELVNNGRVYTIEGNSSGRMVARCNYSLSDNRIDGYGAVTSLNEGSVKTKSPTPDLIQQVIQGVWGNGKERIKWLKEAGYDPVAVQKKVNESLKRTPTIEPKLIDEVILGKWGNGEERVKRLQEAGYDADVVQREVNRRFVES